MFKRHVSLLYIALLYSLFSFLPLYNLNLQYSLLFSLSLVCHILSLPCQQLHGFLSPSLITQALHHAEHKRISVNKWCFSSWCSGMDYSLFLTWMTMIIKSGNTDSSLSLLYSLLLSSDSFSFLGVLFLFYSCPGNWWMSMPPILSLTVNGCEWQLTVRSVISIYQKLLLSIISKYTIWTLDIFIFLVST